jgi:phosphopantothenate-cysteine ligase
MRVLVTGGGTIAPIDDVRHIANGSSGAFSAAISEECLRRGAEVWHIHAPSAQRPFARGAVFNLTVPDARAELERMARLKTEWDAVAPRLHLIALQSGTVADYSQAVQRILTSEPIDVCFLAMAVSDFEPKPQSGKLDSDRGSLIIEAWPTPKVIRACRDWAPNVYLVGFKLLSGATENELVERALQSGRANRADLTVANDWQSVRSRRHTIYLVRDQKPVERLGPSDKLAAELVDRALKWADEKH